MMANYWYRTGSFATTLFHHEVQVRVIPDEFSRNMACYHILAEYGVLPRSTSLCHPEWILAGSPHRSLDPWRPTNKPIQTGLYGFLASHAQCGAIRILVQLVGDEGALPRRRTICVLSSLWFATAFQPSESSRPARQWHHSVSWAGGVRVGSVSVARTRSPAPPCVVPPWQRCRWQRGRDFALEPKLTALATRIFGATTRYEKLMWSSWKQWKCNVHREYNWKQNNAKTKTKQWKCNVHTPKQWKCNVHREYNDIRSDKSVTSLHISIKSIYRIFDSTNP